MARPLRGAGTPRGIALVFLVAGVSTIDAALAAFASPVYRHLPAEYARQVADP